MTPRRTPGLLLFCCEFEPKLYVWGELVGDAVELCVASVSFVLVVLGESQIKAML